MGLLSPLTCRLRAEQFGRTFRKLNGRIQPDFAVHAQHLGLGDHIICNGLVRVLSRRFKVIVLPVKAENIASVRWMYSDLPNVQAQTVERTHDPRYIADIFERAGATSFRAGRYSSKEYDLKRFDESFYEMAEVPFEERWASFKVPRDLDSEDRVVQALAPSEPYIFVHDDPVRGFKIDETRLPSGIKRIRPQSGVTDILFHYRKLIEGASEVHCISSSFAQMLECAPSGRPQFLHHYPRQDGTWSTWRNFQVIE
jgi:hypothetical protein